MTIKELLPILPRYKENSGDYTVIVNYVKNIILWGNKTKYNQSFDYEAITLNRILKDNVKAELLDIEIYLIESGKTLVGGLYDYNLQIYLKENNAEIIDRRK